MATAYQLEPISWLRNLCALDKVAPAVAPDVEPRLLSSAHVVTQAVESSREVTILFYCLASCIYNVIE